MSDAVMRYFPEGTRLTRPSGGFVLWVQLPENVDSLELYKIALQGGITLAPGHVFSATYQFSNFIRLNAAAFNYSTERALERLGGMIKELATHFVVLSLVFIKPHDLFCKIDQAPAQRLRFEHFHGTTEPEQA